MIYLSASLAVVVVSLFVAAAARRERQRTIAASAQLADALVATGADLSAARAHLAEERAARAKAEAEAAAALFDARRLGAELDGWRQENARMRAEIEAGYARELAASHKIAALVRENRRRVS